MRGKQKGGIETTLRLAQINEENPLDALDDAGHKRVAQLLRHFFGAKNEKVSASQRTALDALAAMDAGDRRLVLGLIKSLAEKRAVKQ